MRRKFIAITLCSTIALSVVACGKTEQTASTADTQETVEATESLVELETENDTEMPTQLSADKGENAGNQIAGTNTTTETDGEKPQNDTSITTVAMSNIIWDKYDGQPSPEAFEELKALFLKRWAGSLEDPASMTEEERNEYTEQYANIMNYCRTEEEMHEDAEKDKIAGYDLRIEEGTGLSYLVDNLIGKEYHFGDTTPTGGPYYGQGTIRADVIHSYRYFNPDTQKSDDEILTLLAPEGGYIQ